MWSNPFVSRLSRYAPMVKIHKVDDELLPMLTLEDLKDMGINVVGSRRKMYTAIQKLLEKGNAVVIFALWLKLFEDK
ncbi:hypothetical protein RJT34_20656 [Clitoria ternatea]|uniref:SAM domain-containing protein n=1 Tax=Clitoria ternatea TaxID=43366 RepID=A0AAN9P539_CLITE